LYGSHYERIIYKPATHVTIHTIEEVTEEDINLNKDSPYGDLDGESLLFELFLSRLMNCVLDSTVVEIKGKFIQFIIIIYAVLMQIIESFR
jgi:hypothetical protein